MKTLSQKILTYASVALFYYYTAIGTCFAQLKSAENIVGPKGNTDLKKAAEDVMDTILGFVALIAVIVIIIAGLRMIISSGDEGAVDKGKKTILWAIVGLIVIVISAGIVNIVLG